jgi:hypothetical protein
MTRLLAVCCLALLAMPRPAAAEWHFTPMLGTTFGGSTTLVDLEFNTKGEGATGQIHPNFGGAVTLLGGGIFGVESVVLWTPGFFQTGDLDILKKSRTVSVMGNLVLTAPRHLTEYSLRPFVSAGFGLLHASTLETQKEVLPVKANLPGFDVGGGAIGFFSQRTGIRFDLRYHTSLYRPGEDASVNGRVHLRYMTAGVGLVIRR